MTKLYINTTPCAIQDCNGNVYARSFCQKHYGRIMTYGDPNKVGRVLGENRSKDPVYKVYHAMLDRCNNTKNKYYDYYGGRGIKVAARWLGPEGFTHFKSDMGERPKGLSLDRTDNEKGYSPQNCRWATRKEQQYNQRIPVTNTSGKKGVSLFKRTGKWQAYMYGHKTRIHLGYFNTFEEAVKARIKAERNKEKGLE